MGINFYVHSMTMPGWMSRPYEAETGAHTEEAELEDELKAGAVKFNDFMKEGVTAQLNTIIVKGNREFTNEMLGDLGDSKKSILDIRA